MRLDKFLKVSRIIKRRTVANELCDKGRATVNERVAKASTSLKVGDVVALNYPSQTVRFRVLSLQEHVRKEEAQELYQLLD